MSLDQPVRNYYDEGREAGRLAAPNGRLELLRTRELLTRWLPPAPARVLDVGGGAGVHGLWLAAQGYEVDLLDPVPLHVAQASAASGDATHPLRSAVEGDARNLPFADATFDAVLLLGPLYHLTEAADRARALAEARRVARPGAAVIAAAISRWASTVDGLAGGFLADEAFGAIVAQDVATGQHRNPEGTRDWFTTAYFHRPEELVAEVRAAGLEADGAVAVEGPAGGPGVDRLLDGGANQERVLAAIRRVECEPALLGASAHLLVCGRVPAETAVAAEAAETAPAPDSTPDARAPHTPFRRGYVNDPERPAPPSVPQGLRLELSRSLVLPGKEGEFGEWMQMLHDRYDECLDTLPAERAAFEATFKHTEADGNVWIYHLSLMGEGGAGLDVSNPVDAAHAAWARRVKVGGWEELTPMFLLAPQPILDALGAFGRTGSL